LITFLIADGLYSGTVQRITNITDLHHSSCQHTFFLR